MGIGTRAWFRTHSFTGIITGLLLFVICFSGTFAVFAPELDWLVTPAARVSPGDETVSWGTIEAAARAAHPEAEVGSLQAPLNARAAATVAMSDEDGNAWLVRVDPYTGEVTGSTAHLYDIKRFFRNFHRFLFLPGIGLYLVTLFAVTMLVSVVAALFFYKRWWTRFFRFKATRGRAFWSELHKTAGLWSLWFAVVIIITGLWYLFEAARLDFVDSKANYVGTGEYSVVEVEGGDAPGDAPRRPLDELVGAARQTWPELEIREMGFGWYGPEHALYLGGQDSFPLVRPRANQVQVDTRTGEVLWQNSAGELPAYWIWSNMADPLHFGDFAGLISKSIWFVFGLALSGLILTGTWLHAHRLAGAGRGRHRWPGTIAAIVTTFLVLAASAVFGLGEAARYYGPVVDGVRRLPDLPTGVSLVIFGWIALTVAILIAWAVLLWKPSLLIRPRKRRASIRRAQ